MKMAKRRHDDEDCQRSRPPKRMRYGSRQNILELSDELILRVLSFLSTPDLARCEAVSKKLQSLVNDNEIWREKFFRRFVRPRARRIPSVAKLSESDREASALNYASRKARWLEHSYLTQSETNWKRAYKIKSNWARGLARTSEMVIGMKPSPTVLAKVHRGVTFTVDPENGLRSWRRSQPINAVDLGKSCIPSALALHSDDTMNVTLAVGFADGSVSLFLVDVDGRFLKLGHIESETNGSVASLAIAWPYLLSMSSSHVLNLRRLSTSGSGPSAQVRGDCIAILRSDAEHTPVSLSLRKTNDRVTAGVAYCFYRFNAGWCLGLQELRLDLHRGSMNSLVTSSVDTPFNDHPLLQSAENISKRKPLNIAGSSQIHCRSAVSDPLTLHPQQMHPPNSLSFSGCYILAGLPDNTLMVYTVASTEDTLEINAGRRLWGHTSAIAAAEVISNGKALSISAKSDEMRYWELEDVLSTFSHKRTSTPIKSWTRLNLALAKRGDGLGLALKDLKHEMNLTRKWVGFDEETAVILGERDQRQILSCFDFA